MRFENEFEPYEISINQNYYNDKKIKEIKTKIFKEKFKGENLKNARYNKNVDFGFIFCGFNLNKDILTNLLL